MNTAIILLKLWERKERPSKVASLRTYKREDNPEHSESYKSKFIDDPDSPLYKSVVKLYHVLLLWFHPQALNCCSNMTF